MHFQIAWQNEYFFAIRAWIWFMRLLIMFLQRFFVCEFIVTELALDNIAMEFHMSLEMVFRCNFFVTNVADVCRNFNSVESSMARKQLFVDEALLAIVVRTLERLVASVSCH